MIQIATLNTTALEVFEGKTVVLYSVKPIPMQLFSIFRKLHIQVSFVCVETLDMKQYLKMRALGLRVVKKEHIQDVVGQYDNVIVQGVAFDSDRIASIHQLAQKWGVECSNLTSGEIVNSFSHLIAYDTINNPVIRTAHYINYILRCRQKTSREWIRFKLKMQKDSIVICSPPKTADHSLNYTFEAINNSLDVYNPDVKKIHYINLFHRPRFFKCAWYEKKKPMKIIVGVREPIAQNLSDVYQGVSAGIDLTHWMFAELQNESKTKTQDVLCQYKRLTTKDFNDLQKLFDIRTQQYLNYSNNTKKIMYGPAFIQLFMHHLQLCGLDILEHPFDKQKGYAIVKKGGMEIFVYQLEKLNDLVPELSAWVGVPFDKLENGNQASDKWVGESYKQAQKEIEITQEYFDKCFNEPYVKHCYSESDIEKFKTKWRSHIKQ